MPDGADYPVQASISTLTAHSKDNKEPKVKELRGLGLAVTRFLYLTKSPEPHPDIVKYVDELRRPESKRTTKAETLAKYKRWVPVVPLVLLVDATALVGVWLHAGSGVSRACAFQAPGAPPSFLRIQPRWRDDK